MNRLIAVLLALALLGCDQQALLERFVPKDEGAIAKELIARLALRDYPAVEAKLDKSLQTSEMHSKLEEIAELFPNEEPKSIHTIGVYTSQVNADTSYSLTFEYEYSSTWLVANVVMHRSDGAVAVTGIHVTLHKQSLEAEYTFSFGDKSWLRYVVFALAITIPLFIVYVFVVCLRTKMPKRKWLWLIFIALGFFQFQLNWATGAWDLQPLSFLLLGAGFMKAAPAAPLILSVAFPLGAILFLVRRKSIGRMDDVIAPP